MSNEKVKIDSIKEGTSGWYNIHLADGREVSIAPDKVVAVKSNLFVGYEGEFNLYQNKEKTKWFATAPQAEKKFFGGKMPSKDNSVGQTIGNAISNAVLLVCHGKADIKDLEKYAERIAEISINLKAKYKDKIEI